MRALSIKPYDVPEFLLEQKEWDTDVYMRIATRDPDEWHSFLFYDRDETDPVAFVLLAEQELYNDLYCDTLIIDKPRRTLAVTREVMRVVRELMLGIASLKGFSTISVICPPGSGGGLPRAVLRVLAKDGCAGYVLNTSIREQVG